MRLPTSMPQADFPSYVPIQLLPHGTWSVFIRERRSWTSESTCNSESRDSRNCRVAVTGGSPANRGSLKTGGECGTPLVVPSNPNSRRGRKARSPIRQGRVAMDMITVGIDVSKDRLDVVVRPSGEVFAVDRNAAGLELLAARLREVSPHLVALEATGGFETVAAAALASASLPVVVVNPAQVRAFAKALGQRAKTDPIDAAVIAHFAEATKPEVRPLPDEATRLLSDLVARRRQIIEMIGAERQREKRITLARVKKSIGRLIATLEKELASVDGEIDDAMQGSPVWRAKEDLLASVPAVGPTIARTLMAELPELGQLSRRQDCGFGRPGSVHPTIRTMAWQKLHWRWAHCRTHRPVHGRHGCQAAQPSPASVL